MQIRSAAKWIAVAAGILVGAVIVGFTLKDTTYIEAKLEQIKGARQSVTAVEKTTAKTQKIKTVETVKETPLPESAVFLILNLQVRCRSFLPDVRSHLLRWF